MRKTPINTKELKFASQDGKTVNISMQTHNVSLQEKERPTPGATKIVEKKTIIEDALRKFAFPEIIIQAIKRLALFE